MITLNKIFPCDSVRQCRLLTLAMCRVTIVNYIQPVLTLFCHGQVLILCKFCVCRLGGWLLCWADDVPRPLFIVGGILVNI